MTYHSNRVNRFRYLVLLIAAIAVAAIIMGGWYLIGARSFSPSAPSDVGETARPGPGGAATLRSSSSAATAEADLPSRRPQFDPVPKRTRDSSGFFQMAALIKPWPVTASLA